MRLAATIAVFVLIVIAAPLFASAQCHGSEANDIYARFRDNFKGAPEQQKVAYTAAKDYLAKFSNCPDEGDKAITAYLTDWAKKYDSAMEEYNCRAMIEKDPVASFNACAALAAKAPDKLDHSLVLVGIAARAARQGDNSLYPRAAKAARASLDLITAGKMADQWWPFADKGEAVAGLNYYYGLFTYESSPKDAIPPLLIVAKSGSKYAGEPTTYQILAIAYYTARYGPLTADYKTKCEGKLASPECDAMYGKVMAALDLVIDGYARAVAISSKSPEQSASFDKVRSDLTAFYKARHDNSDAGLDAFIAGVLSKPLPEPK